MKPRLILLAMFSLAISGLSGCAFFNTYFNARKAFQNGKAAVERSWDQKSLQRQPGQAITSDRFDEMYINTPDDAKTFFTTAIEKGNKVVVLHQGSRWVEDAILLLGKAHFLRGTGNDYYDAKNRFEVLFLKYPNSRFSAEARLWYAKTLIQLNLTESAYGILREITGSAEDPDILAEARLLTGEKHLSENRPDEALSDFRAADSLARRITLRRQACFKTAILYFNREDFGTAYRYFRKLSRLDLPVQDQFDVTLLTARTLKHQEKFDDAIRLLDKLLGDNRFKNHFVTAEFEIADILFLQKRYKEAEKQLKYTIDAYRNPQVTGDAYFMLGTLYDTVYQSPDTAKKYYHIVKSRYPQSAFTAQAEERLMQLQKMDFFQQTIRGEYELIRWMNLMLANPDSLSEPVVTDTVTASGSPVDTLETSAAVSDSGLEKDSTGDPDRITAIMDTVNLDSLDWLKDLESNGEEEKDIPVKGKDDSKSFTETKKTDTVTVKSVFEKDFKEAVIEHKELTERLQFLRQERERLRNLRSGDSLTGNIPRCFDRLGVLYFDLGDFFFYTAGRPDSALHYYSVVADSFAGTSSAEPAMYAIAGVTEKINPPQYLPALKKAYRTFPEGNYAHLYRRIFEAGESAADSSESFFLEAENALALEDYDKALAVYCGIALRDTSDNQGRAFFMMGTIQERLGNSDEAFRAYRTLSYSHPGHPLAGKVIDKIRQFAVRRNIPEDSTIFFVDTNFVRVDFSVYRKHLAADSSDSSADSNRINLKADTVKTDSLSGINDQKESGSEIETNQGGGEMQNDSSGVQMNKEADKKEMPVLDDSLKTRDDNKDDD